MDIDKIKKLKGTSRSDSDIKYLRNAITELAFAIMVNNETLFKLLDKYQRKVEECRRLREKIKKLEKQRGKEK